MSLVFSVLATEAAACPEGYTCPLAEGCTEVSQCIPPEEISSGTSTTTVPAETFTAPQDSGSSTTVQQPSDHIRQQEERRRQEDAIRLRQDSLERARDRLGRPDVDTGVRVPRQTPEGLSDQINRLGSIIKDRKEEEPCPWVEVAYGSPQYHRNLGVDNDREAEDFSEWEEEWRRHARQWRELAETARRNGDAAEAERREARARSLDGLADDYARWAERARRRAEEARRQAEETERREQEQAERVCSTPALVGNKVAVVSEPPQNVAPPEPPSMVCGPDVTENVLRVMRKMHTDWRNMDSSTKGAKCRNLIDPMTALTAWDINALSPSAAPVSRESYAEAFGPNANYDRYLQGRFWFEVVSDRCAIPRHYPCGPTVVFLGQCIHSQVVNYVQWGFLNKLCDQEGIAATVHSFRSTVNRVPEHLHAGQEAMTAIGSTYAANVMNWNQSMFRSLDPAEQNIEMEAHMARRLSRVMNDPELSAFLQRPETACTMACRLTPEEEASLRRRNFRYVWTGSSRSR